MVIHVLKDGSRVTSVSGFVVKKTEAPSIYKILDNINKSCRRV